MSEINREQVSYLSLLILILTCVVAITEIIIHIRRAIQLHHLELNIAAWLFLAVYCASVLFAVFLYTKPTPLSQRIYMITSSISLGVLLKELYVIFSISPVLIIIFHISLCFLNCLCVILAWNVLHDRNCEVM